MSDKLSSIGRSRGGKSPRDQFDSRKGSLKFSVRISLSSVRKKPRVRPDLTMKELLWDSPLPRSVIESTVQIFASLYKLKENDSSFQMFLLILCCNEQFATQVTYVFSLCLVRSMQEKLNFHRNYMLDVLLVSETNPLMLGYIL